MAKNTTLYTPDGRKYVTDDKAEVTRLVAYGYTTKAPKKSAPSKPADDASKS